MKFIHLRNTDRSGAVDCKGGATVAYTVTDGQITFAVARCNASDHFVKSRGRAMAGGRLNSPRHAHVLTMDENAFFNKIQRNWTVGPQALLIGLAAPANS